MEPNKEIPASAPAVPTLGSPIYSRQTEPRSVRPSDPDRSVLETPSPSEQRRRYRARTPVTPVRAPVRPARSPPKPRREEKRGGIRMYAEPPSGGFKEGQKPQSWLVYPNDVWHVPAYLGGPTLNAPQVKVPEKDNDDTHMAAATNLRNAVARDELEGKLESALKNLTEQALTSGLTTPDIIFALQQEIVRNWPALK